jgi:bifunctional non-homologous end joining protein LigD
MALAEYRHKRNFRKTPEPRGKRRMRRRGERAFVIQKHDASHLHYDFRLEHDGVLKSWAVPKGPDLDPANKRLAMQVEDHPREYGGFEGTIPEGEYGAGTVMLWDKGVWEPIGDPAKGLREGRLKFVLRGEKLQGGWMLVRKGGQRAGPAERHWFLFKERDEFARPGKPITEELPLSVTTGRNLEEIAAESHRVWGPGGEIRQGRRRTARAPAPARPKRKKAARGRVSTGGRKVSRGKAQPRNAHNDDRFSLRELLEGYGARLAPLPKQHGVELATLVDAVPAGDDWVHEIKFDGYRMLCRVARGKARFISRNGRDWTGKFPELAGAAGGLDVDQALLDGEVVALRPDGTTSFQVLQNIFQAGRTSELIYYAFDVLHLNGHDLTTVPFELRKDVLKRVILEAHPSIRYSDFIQGSGRDVIDEACRLHLEGVVCKRRGSPYRAGRGLDWLKVKCSAREEFVIGGFTRPAGTRKHFGALLLGYYDHDQKLIYAGRVGTGFNKTTLNALHAKLVKLVRARSPYSNLSGTTGDAKGVSWVKPVLVAEIEFSNWTDEGLLRHPAFQGLREDKPAGKVIHEKPMSLNEVKMIDRDGKPAATHRNRNRQRFTAASRRRRSPRTSAPEDDFGGVRLTHPDKVLYPDGALTKHDLATYYTRVADWMLPHVADRPLAIVRCPDGSTKACFFQKHHGESAPKDLRRVNVAEHGAPEYHLMIDDVAGLISLVQMGVLEIHVWGSRASNLEKPDRLIFDLDPDPAVAWPEVTSAARSVRLLLEEFGLNSFLKTTGGKGLHLVVPVQPRAGWDEAKAFCQAVAAFMARTAPDRFIAKASKAARKGKIFIDYLRNGRGATAVAAFSTRNKPGATVSAPIAWEELNASLHSDHFTIKNLPARLAKLGKDPWADFATTKQSITAAMVKQLAGRK